ncbi:MAG TPA: indolepyruvate ferredoxin oxidoreductase subunit alpha, partial [Thermodesulfobacteriota bacterium]|nr:indolepyruvate ferredoxin oxidoreductase subunit alpha [Thermodesulfobacteriota bacterium]
MPVVLNVGALAPQAEALLSGSQALARGAIEAGVVVAVGCAQPPAAAVVEALLPAAGPELRVEWAVNERLAIEIAAGVAWSGKRALAAVSGAGLAGAAPALVGLATGGTGGGLVVVVGDDPGAGYGWPEHDSRYVALMTALPL